VIEVSADDTVERIIAHTNKITKVGGRRFEELNVKLVPRVYLDWNGTPGTAKAPKQHWPTDLAEFDYDSPAFQERLKGLIAKLGQAWDRDPRIFAVQMGLIGYWGEHHNPAPTAAQRRLLTEAFRKACPHKPVLVRHTNPRGVCGQVQDALRDANVFIGVSGPGTLQAKHLRRMAPKAIVFALANPTPEIMPEEAARFAYIVATGRSDYPNQINNVLAFPGIFRGALDVRAAQITESMKQAAARAIAQCITPRELSTEYIVPSVFNRQVVQRVAAAVQRAALQGGVARKGK
jgi:hypothetical protein